MSLTETDIKALRVTEREQWVNDGAGLYLRVAAHVGNGKKPTVEDLEPPWVWRSKKSGVTSYVTLGHWPGLTVKQARAARDRRAGRSVPVNALTVGAALEEWFRDQIEDEYRVTKNVRVYINKAIADAGSRRLQEWSRAEIARFVRDYGRQSPVAANRCLATLKLFLGWAAEVGYLETNPAAELTRRVAGGEEGSRSRVLSDNELRALWRLESPNTNLLRALLLTGCRIAELQRASLAHVTDEAVSADGARHAGPWLLIPAAHSKNGRAHHVYLADETRVQFNGGSPLLFRSVSPTAVQAWLRRLQSDEDGNPREPWAGRRPVDKETGQPVDAWTPHDLRRTFSTKLHELGVAPHVVEKLLNHTPQGMAAIYNRSELFSERIEASQKWAAALSRIVA